MISSRRHNETDPRTGKNLYIIEAYLRDAETLEITDVPNREFEGDRYKIRFHRGVGRTISRQKAQWCSEQHDMVVTLHQDDKPWIEVKEGQRDVVPIDDEDSDYTVDAGDFEE